MSATLPRPIAARRDRAAVAYLPHTNRSLLHVTPRRRAAATRARLVRVWAPRLQLMSEVLAGVAAVAFTAAVGVFVAAVLLGAI